MDDTAIPEGEAEVVYEIDNFQTADLIVRVLRDEGVHCAMRNDSPSAGIAGTVSLGDGLDSAHWAEFAVMTPKSQAEKAKEIIASWLAAEPVVEGEE